MDKAHQERLLVQIEEFISRVIRIATYDRAPDDRSEYLATRKMLMRDPFVGPLLPRFVKSSRTAVDLRTHCQEKGGYAPRRAYINEQFEALRRRLEVAVTAPADDGIADLLKNVDADHVRQLWKKSVERRDADPDGAVTAARSLLEAVMKHILSERGVQYDENADLPGLYKAIANTLSLAPSKQADAAFREMCSGCFSVIKGLGATRSKASDAHGRSPGVPGPKPHHAALVVNFAGSMAAFLVGVHNSQSSVKTEAERRASESLPVGEIRELFWKFADALPERQKLVLALIKTEGMTPEEIAAILDVETDYVEKLKVSADEAVKKQIGGEVLSMVARIDALKRKK
jgi:hypothetical protein